MTRRTSIEVYNEIKNNGLLSRRRFEVYEALVKFGPATGSELFHHMKDFRNPTHSNITTRLGELREMGVVEELGETICSISGNNVILWDTTDKLPRKLMTNQTPTKNNLIKALCGALDEMNKHLDEQGNKVPEYWRNWNETSKKIVKQCSKYRKKK